MKVISTIVLMYFGYHTTCCAQTGSSAWDSAIVLEGVKKYSDAIIEYDKALTEVDDLCKRTFLNYRLYVCYQNIGDSSTGSKYLKKCSTAKLCGAGRRENGWKKFVLRQVGKLWFSENKPDSALSYFKASTPDKISFGINTFSFAMINSFDIFHCYVRLNMPDSAIHYFTSFAFDSTGYPGDEEYKIQMKEYYDLLLNKYSANRVKKEFLKGVNRLQFKRIIRTDTTARGTIHYSAGFEVVFTFFGIKTDLNGTKGSLWSINSPLTVDAELGYINREYFQQQLYASHLYNLIMSRFL